MAIERNNMETELNQIKLSKTKELTGSMFSDPKATDEWSEFLEKGV